VERYDHCHGDLAGYGCARKVRLILLDGIDADQECASLLAYRPLEGTGGLKIRRGREGPFLIEGAEVF
jgi:hypothetical protein